MDDKWGTPPKGNDRYRAVSALRYFKPSGSQYGFMISLIDRANWETGRCDPGTETLCNDTGLKTSAIEKARAFWRKRGVISYRLRGDVASAVYYINWDMLNKILYENYRNISNKAVAARMTKIEEAKRATGAITEKDREWLEGIADGYEYQTGEGLGGWAYRLLG
jgi:hypothetical protein